MFFNMKNRKILKVCNFENSKFDKFKTKNEKSNIPCKCFCKFGNFEMFESLVALGNFK